MANLKQGMEEECQRLQETLRELIRNRETIENEFSELNGMHRQLIVQLRDDTLAGEGQLHTFQSEKRRLEERLEELEKQLREKNEQLLHLDAKASEYLLNVTTASNTLYDEEGQADHSESTSNFVKQLVNEELEAAKKEEEEEEEEEASRDDSEGSESNEDAGSSDGEDGSEPEENIAFKVRLNDESITSDAQEIFESKGFRENDTDEDDETTTRDLTPPTKEQMLTLSTVVTELKNLKDQMGRCMTAKDESIIELEGQLLATKKELAVLRGSMSDLSFELHRREDGYQSSDRGRSVDRLSHDEKFEFMHKMNEFESPIPMTDDQLDMEEFVFDRRSNLGIDSRDGSPGSHRRSSGVRSPSVLSSLSGRVAMLEKELNDANEKLSKNHRRMRVLAMEKQHKQKECELLQLKADNVELKMSDLQSSFDTLVKAMMLERDELVQKMEEKDNLIEELKVNTSNLETTIQQEPLQDLMPKEVLESSINAIEKKYCDKLNACQNSYEELKSKHSNEIQNLKENISRLNEEHAATVKTYEEQIAELKSSYKKAEEEVAKFQEGINNSDGEKEKELQSLIESEKKKCSTLRKHLDGKENEISELNSKIRRLEGKVSEAALPFQQQVDELKEHVAQYQDEIKNLENRVNEVVEERDSLTKKNEDLKLQLQKFESDSVEFGSMESLKQQLEEQKQKLNALNSMNDNLNCAINNKDKEIQEELNAREATIQELRITLTNNQKQSRENYQMLQDDMAAIQIRHNKEKEESQAVVAHLKEKLIKTEEEAEKSRKELENLKEQMEGANESDKPDVDGDAEGIKEQLVDEIASKAELINNLEEKVSQLESQLLNSSLASENQKRENKSDSEDYKTRFEEQMALIKKLNKEIDDLRRKLDQLACETTSLKQNVDQLESEKASVEEERHTLQKELDEIKSSNNYLENDLETKKKLG